MWLCNKHCANLKACYFVRQWILNLQIQKAWLGFHKIADLLCYYLLLYYPQGGGGHGHPRTPWPRPYPNGLEPFIGLKVSHNEQKHAWSVVTSSISRSNFLGETKVSFLLLNTTYWPRVTWTVGDKRGSTLFSLLSRSVASVCLYLTIK